MLCREICAVRVEKEFPRSDTCFMHLSRWLMTIFLINTSFEFCADYFICRLCVALKRQIIKTFYHRSRIFVVAILLKNILLTAVFFERVISSINFATTLIQELLLIFLVFFQKNIFLNVCSFLKYTEHRLQLRTNIFDELGNTERNIFDVTLK